MSQETKALFERRAKEYQKQKPTAERRKSWNKKIQIACRNDYRSWVARWVDKIEQADNRGDTKAIYRGVKNLSGSSAFSTTKPTEKLQKTDPTGAARAQTAEETTRASDPKSESRASAPKKDVGASADESATAKAAKARASGEKKFKRATASTRINGPEELARVWHDFLSEKFSATKMEQLRAEFEACLRAMKNKN